MLVSARDQFDRDPVGAEPWLRQVEALDAFALVSCLGVDLPEAQLTEAIAAPTKYLCIAVIPVDLNYLLGRTCALARILGL